MADRLGVRVLVGGRVESVDVGEMRGLTTGEIVQSPAFRRRSANGTPWRSWCSDVLPTHMNDARRANSLTLDNWALCELR